MKLVELPLVSLDIEPGWRAMGDDVPLGKKYLVDLDNEAYAILANTDLGKSVKVRCLWVVEPTIGYLPACVFGLGGVSDIVS